MIKYFPGCEADHSPPSSAKVKNTWSFTSTPICLHGMVLNKHEICLHGVVLRSTGTILTFTFTIGFSTLSCLSTYHGSCKLFGHSTLESCHL